MKSSRTSKPVTTSSQTQPQTPPKTQPKSPAKSPQANQPATPRRRKGKKKRKYVSLLPPAVVTRQGKTTIRRFEDRALHRMEETQGKVVDYVELFTSTGHQSIQIRFQDGTSFYCMFEPCFVVEREYADATTGDWQTLKTWPRIHSQD